LTAATQSQRGDVAVESVGSNIELNKKSRNVRQSTVEAKACVEPPYCNCAIVNRCQCEAAWANTIVCVYKPNHFRCEYEGLVCNEIDDCEYSSQQAQICRVNSLDEADVVLQLTKPDGQPCKPITCRNMTGVEDIVTTVEPMLYNNTRENKTVRGEPARSQESKFSLRCIALSLRLKMRE